MAGKYGPKVAKGRVGLFWDSIQVNAAGSQARLVNPVVKVDRDSGFTATDNWLTVWSVASDVVNDVDRSVGSLTGSGVRNLETLTAGWVDLYYGSITTESVQVGLNINNYSHSLDVDVEIDFPARAYQLPAAPTGLTCTRNSDTSYLIKWTSQSTGGPTTAAPYTNVVVQRQEWTQAGWGAWATVATLAGTITQWTDTTTLPNRRYAWRVRGSNSSGLGAAATTSAYATTPSAVANLKIVKAGTTVTVSWENTALYQTAVYIEWEQSGSWGSPEALPAAATSKNYTVNPSLSHRWRVRAYNGLYSAEAVSPVVTVVAPPLAPSVQVDPPVLDATLTDLAVAWQHHPTDFTEQQAYKLRYSLNGANTWTELSGTTADGRVIPAGTLANSQAYEIQVATRGDDPQFGPWSPSVIVTTGPTPSVTPAAPSPAVSRPVLLWEYIGSTQQAGWVATLYDQAMTLIEEVTGAGAGTTVTFATVLDDATSYVWGIRARDGIGLWSVEVHEGWTTALARPPKPSLTAEFDPEQGNVIVDVTTPAGMPEAVAVEVWRGGVLVGRIAPTDQLVDEIPPTNSTVVYTAVAWADPPTSTASDPVEVDTGSPEWLFFNAGEGWQVKARVKANPKVAVQPRRTKVLHTFVEEDEPREFIGRGRRRTVRVSGEVDGYGRRPEIGSWSAFDLLADQAAPICYRDPMGNREFCSIDDVDIEWDATRTRATVSCVLTVVSYVEGQDSG